MCFGVAADEISIPSSFTGTQNSFERSLSYYNLNNYLIANYYLNFMTKNRSFWTTLPLKWLQIDLILFKDCALI